jgi:hypothetical protein
MVRKINTTSYSLELPDVSYDNFQSRLVSFLKTETVRFQLIPEEIKSLNIVSLNWEKQYALYVDPATRTSIVTLAK